LVMSGRKLSDRASATRIIELYPERARGAKSPDRERDSASGSRRR
jgi:hypothetical protein